EHVRLAFNISSAQLNSQAWPQRLLLVLEECGLVPQRVEVEVTETALVQDLHRAQLALATLRGGGARIALDDFGTGTSSLHHLREFKVDELKIDREFVGAVLCDPGAAALIRGVIGLAHGLDLKVTAEGVEQQEQAAALLALQCDQAQGYLYGAALSAAEAASLAQNDWVESSPAAQAKARDAGECWRMRVVERRVDWVGRQRRGVVAIELHERGHQLASICGASREGVGLELVAPRPDRSQGCQEQGERRYRQEEQQQGGVSGGGRHA